VYCYSNVLTVNYIAIYCGTWQCYLNQYSFDVTVTGCPGNPVFYITTKPDLCMSGTFVLRPA
jgi:hypothetical protein